MIEYRLLVIERSIEIYGGLIALFFVTVGIWLGLRLTKNRVFVKELPIEVPVEIRVPASEPFVLNLVKLEQLGIAAREPKV